MSPRLFFLPLDTLNRALQPSKLQDIFSAPWLIAGALLSAFSGFCNLLPARISRLSSGFVPQTPCTCNITQEEPTLLFITSQVYIDRLRFQDIQIFLKSTVPQDTSQPALPYAHPVLV